LKNEIYPFNSPLSFFKTKKSKINNDKSPLTKKNMDKFFQKYAEGTLHSHSAIAPFGSPNTVYAIRSLYFALPYFAPLRSAKHRIY